VTNRHALVYHEVKDVVGGSTLVLLAGSSESPEAEATQGFVLRLSTGRALSPELERAGCELGTHELDHVAWRQSELSLNGIEGRSIFPRHLDDSVDVRISQRSVVLCNWIVFMLGHWIVLVQDHVRRLAQAVAGMISSAIIML